MNTRGNSVQQQQSIYNKFENDWRTKQKKYARERARSKYIKCPKSKHFNQFEQDVRR